MPKSPNQKLKLLYLMQIFLRDTDQAHTITVAELISRLANLGISAERKSLYDDIEVLRTFGLDIIQIKSKSTGYYVGSREFELPELKLLVDSIQSSKFITEKKTLSLIKKIENLASVHDARLLQRQVYVRNRVKSMNESVYYNVDEISAAINLDKMVRFKYFEYSVTKERKFRRNGEIYEISPLRLMWEDENYYMIGWDNNAGITKHYRVDKMAEISVSDKPRLGKGEFSDNDTAEYSKKVFGMFTGEEQLVKLKFRNKLVGPVIDRFGTDIIIVAAGDDYFTVSVNVAVSRQFYAWLFGFGQDVEIVAPQNIRSDMRKYALEIANMY